MPYLVQGSYTTEGWMNQIKNPIDRVPLARAAIEKFGGKLIADYYAFGEYDFCLLMDMPDDETAAGLVLGFVAAGHLKNIKTTKLLSGDEGVGALKKAGTMAYQPPKSQ